MVVAADLVAHTLDVNVNGARIARVIESPYAGKQLLTGKYDSGIGGEAVEQFKFLGRHDHVVPVNADAVFVMVDLESRVHDPGGRRRAVCFVIGIGMPRYKFRVSDRGLQARAEFSGLKGRDDIIIRSKFQREDNIERIPLRTDNNYLNIGERTEFFADLQRILTVSEPE